MYRSERSMGEEVYNLLRQMVNTYGIKLIQEELANVCFNISEELVEAKYSPNSIEVRKWVKTGKHLFPIGKDFPIVGKL